MKELIKLARQICECSELSEEQKTKICVIMGFNDTSFIEKSSKGKLKDFLLNENN
jgi:hypothetical protein